MSVMAGMQVLTRLFASSCLLGHHDGANGYGSFSSPFLTKTPPGDASGASSSSALHPSLVSLSGARQSHGVNLQSEGDSADRGIPSAELRLLVLVLALGAISTESAPAPDSAVEDPPLRTHISVRVPLSATFTAIDTANNNNNSNMLPLRLERTVELNGLTSPLIVLQFPGFRLSLLSDKQREQLRALAGRLLRHAVTFAAVYAFYAFGLQLISLWSAAFVQVAVHALITFSTFMSCAMLAMDAKKQARYASHAKTVAGVGHRQSRRRSRLPSLTPNQRAAVLSKRQRMGYAFFDGIEDPAMDKERRFSHSASSSSTCSSPSSSSSASSRSDSTTGLPLIGHRVAEQLKQSSPSVNVVYGDRRRRSQASLADAKIRVGKAHTQQMPGHKKPQDIYVVRVDCSSPDQASPSSKKQEKHMNPTVMWDITATFDEFQKLERELKKEAKAKKLAGEAGKVPHLSSGAVLFVQRELDEHVLHARRQRLQAFLDAVRANRALATSDALRKFCQAY